VQWVGPARYTPVPCALADIPAVDAVVLSHNHYDHMDADTLRVFAAAHAAHVLAPLGNAPVLKSFGFPPERVHVLDWWDARGLELALPAAEDGAPPVRTTLELACTPAQHTAARSATDKWCSLWASWALAGAPASAGAPRPRVFFGGDTGYRTVLDGEDEDAVPVCPAFKQAGDAFDGFDLALLPIGCVRRACGTGDAEAEIYAMAARTRRGTCGRACTRLPRTRCASSRMCAQSARSACTGVRHTRCLPRSR
jgi:N-acyl-phosphatidylethanolamine-hydrolysing phospholipase D